MAPRVKRIRITAVEFQQFCDLRHKHRWDWPAVFGTNSKGKIWGFQTYGKTPEDKRDYVDGFSPLLDQVAGIFSEQREECGRFFIDERGAFFKRDGSELQFVQWDSCGEKLQSPVQAQPQRPPASEKMTYKDLLERVRSRRKEK